MPSATRFALPLVLILAACGGHRTVPDSALAMVPSESITEINAVQEQVYVDKTAIESAERQLASLEEQAQLAQRSVKEADVSVTKATQARAVAVRVGDAERARVLAEDLEDTRKRLEERQSTAELLDAKVKLAKEQLAARQAGYEFQTLKLELARAKAASLGGANVKVKRYEKQLEKAREAMADAVATVDEYEKRTGVSL